LQYFLLGWKIHLLAFMRQVLVEEVKLTLFDDFRFGVVGENSIVDLTRLLERMETSSDIRAGACTSRDGLVRMPN
jgi:hypothetical protein